MKWYYVEAGQQAGPVEETQLEELSRSGKLQPDTLVWHEGMTEWQPYSAVKPAGATAAAEAPPVYAAGPAVGADSGGLICSECGRSFAPNDVIRYRDRWICAGCKPTFFQRLSEGAPLGNAGIGYTATEADLLARDYDVDVGDCLTRGWETFKANAGIMIGASVLVYLTLMAVNIIPYLNIVLALVFTGPLMGGLWFFYVKKIRNQDAGIGDAFSGFGPRFWQLVMTRLIPALIWLGLVAIIGLLAALTIPALVRNGRVAGGVAPTLAPGMLVGVGLLFFAVLLVVIFLSTCWLFALPLVSDKGLRFWPALELSRRVVMKHWWMTFWLLFVAGIVGAVGIFACGIGVLVTGPVAFAAVVSHYQKVFGDLSPQQN
jgi:hypothetical protein